MYSLITNPSPRFENIIMKFGVKGVLTDKHMLETLIMDNIPSITIETNIFELTSTAQKEENIDLETEEGLKQMVHDMNLIYKSTTFTNASTKSELSFDFSIRKLNSK